MTTDREEMLIRRYDLEVTSPPCEPGAERWSAFAHLEDDISEVLPYLNAVWKGAIYDHDAQILTWRMGGRAVSVRPRELAVSNLEDRDEAAEVVERLIARINEVWARRGEIQPSLARRRRLVALDVYKLLPGGNCRACGEPTCFVFATKLTTGQVSVEACTPLFTEEHAEKRERLLALLEEAGAG
jgi:ArsR family metal-binding transcriptional regulator